MFRRICPWLLLVLLITSCSGSFGTSPGRGYLSADGNIRLVEPGDRGDPITLSGSDLDGEPLSLPRASKGATVVNIWWSGCVECRIEAPLLQRVASAEPQVADFLGIDIRESGPAQAQRFEERFKIPYRSFYDPGGQLLLNLRGAVPYSAIPTTVVLDRQMRVGAVILGEIPSERTLKDLVETVLELPDRALGTPSSE